MKKKAILSAVTAVFLCFAIIFGSTAAFAANTKPDETVTDITIKNQSGVLEGETLQLTATVNASSTFFDNVEWSSSNPEVISCTKDGKITGLVAGKSATITCKAKYGKTSDEITVYCVKKLSAQVKSNFNSYLVLVYPYPDAVFWKDICLDISPLVKPLSEFFYILSFMSSFSSVNSVISKKVTVCGKSGSYAYIRYGENNEYDGFVKSTKLKTAGNAFLKLSATDMDVWANGVSYSHRKLTANYSDDVQWDVEHENEYLSFDRETGQITGLVPGKTVTVTATADGETATCTIHLLYKWLQAWTAKTNRDTNIYYSSGDGYSKGAALSKNTEFVVEGDCGTDDGWAYGYVKETNTWGFVPISHISTKNTISYYNGLNWGWPLENKNYNYVNSPYAPRPSLNDEHRGFDINEKSNQADIAGQALVAPFDGVVKRVGADLNTTNGCGYYICITSNTVDPVTGKNLIVIYQHMKSNSPLRDGYEVKKGEIVGYAGNTGRSEGSHLHFEVNNWNAGIGDTGRSDFTYTINPIYFYVDMVKNDELILNMDCSAVNSGYSFYFYNYDE